MSQDRPRPRSITVVVGRSGAGRSQPDLADAEKPLRSYATPDHQRHGDRKEYAGALHPVGSLMEVSNLGVELGTPLLGG
ncbi:MAG: hypothetical protein K0U78_10815 [Actinomycetia bacterium]|nr:hypothetical protein [Actinomycetes bacterium]